jgi:predicted TIM-barrel fold metal-dependent hydrolase
MIYDIHAHVIELRSGQHGNYLCSRERTGLFLKLLARNIARRMPSGTAASADEVAQQQVSKWIAESLVDRVVLLALDGAYRQDGSLDMEHTRLITANDFTADLAASHPKTLFGASIHPYRKDALQELERIIQRGACLIKWLPSAQNIAPDDPRCLPFYECMAHHRLPLLVHTGIEHTLSAFDNALDAPHRLVPALRRGVTVIAAHCGTRMFLHERSFFPEWARLAKEHSAFYGDLSVFCLPLHGQPLRRILNDPDLRAKVVFGSDFPAAPMPLWFMASLGWETAMALHRIENPFDRPYRTLKALGVPDEVFSRAGGLLRIAA